MREEFTEHEGMVGLGMIARQPNILVHVERDDVLEPEGEDKTGGVLARQRKD